MERSKPEINMEEWELPWCLRCGFSHKKADGCNPEDLKINEMCDGDYVTANDGGAQ